MNVNISHQKTSRQNLWLYSFLEKIAGLVSKVGTEIREHSHANAAAGLVNRGHYSYRILATGSKQSHRLQYKCKVCTDKGKCHMGRSMRFTCVLSNVLCWSMPGGVFLRSTIWNWIIGNEWLLLNKDVNCLLQFYKEKKTSLLTYIYIYIYIYIYNNIVPASDDDDVTEVWVLWVPTSSVLLFTWNQGILNGVPLYMETHPMQ
jgi:hypothetical protein